MIIKYFLQKARGPFGLIYYEACINEQDARTREKYLKSGMGKRYIRNRLKHFLSLTGYTFIEIIFVVVVLAVLAAIAIPRLGVPYAIKMKVKTAAQRLVSDLRYTRRLAITNHEDYKLSVGSTNNEYTISDADGTQVGITRSIDSDITVSADKDFIFESLGNADAASDTSISFSADGNQADITVTKATGAVNVSGP